MVSVMSVAVDHAEIGGRARSVVDEPDEPAAVHVVGSRSVGDDDEVAGLARPKAVVGVARIDEIVTADRVGARCPYRARRSVDARVTDVGKALRRRVEYLALDGGSVGVQGPSLERRCECNEDDGVAGLVGVDGRRRGGIGRHPRGARLAVAGRDADHAVGDEDDVVTADREAVDGRVSIDDGSAASGECPGWHHDVRLRAARVTSDEM